MAKNAGSMPESMPIRRASHRPEIIFGGADKKRAAATRWITDHGIELS